MERKGQSALEYLMTYGWALIVIAIVIGVLVFIMSTTTSGANCTSDNTQIIYVDHAVTGDDGSGTGTFELRLQNGAGKTIDITAVDLEMDFNGTIAALGNQISGAEFTMASTDLTAPLANETYRGEVAITYTRGTGGISHIATITCTGTAA